LPEESAGLLLLHGEKQSRRAPPAFKPRKQTSKFHLQSSREPLSSKSQRAHARQKTPQVNFSAQFPHRKTSAAHPPRPPT
jgi:hypothetical protein